MADHLKLYLILMPHTSQCLSFDAGTCVKTYMTGSCSDAITGVTQDCVAAGTSTQKNVMEEAADIPASGSMTESTE